MKTSAVLLVLECIMAACVGLFIPTVIVAVVALKYGNATATVILLPLALAAASLGTSAGIIDLVLRTKSNGAKK